MSAFTNKSVVVPVDFSSASAVAINTALTTVEDPSAVHLVHVLYPLDGISPGVVWGEVTNEKREAAVGAYFQEYLAENEIAGVTTTVRIGDPGLEIVDYANEVAADLIVMPSHGYRGIRRVLLGSVAERVLRHAGCSVLILRFADSA